MELVSVFQWMRTCHSLTLVIKRLGCGAEADVNIRHSHTAKNGFEFWISAGSAYVSLRIWYQYIPGTSPALSFLGSLSEYLHLLVAFNLISIIKRHCFAAHYPLNIFLMSSLWSWVACSLDLCWFMIDRTWSGRLVIVTRSEAKCPEIDMKLELSCMGDP